MDVHDVATVHAEYDEEDEVCVRQRFFIPLATEICVCMCLVRASHALVHLGTRMAR